MTFACPRRTITHIKLYCHRCRLKTVKMGAILGSAMKETMEENLKKNQEFMKETQKMQV